MTTAGAVREQVWDDLLARGACAYPLPPHGHCPNFTHAKKAAAQLLAHPDLTTRHTLIVGPERALLPLRQQSLKAGKTLYVPHQKKEGWYWRVTDPRGARLSTLPPGLRRPRRPAAAPDRASSARSCGCACRSDRRSKARRRRSAATRQ